EPFASRDVPRHLAVHHDRGPGDLRVADRALADGECVLRRDLALHLAFDADRSLEGELAADLATLAEDPAGSARLVPPGRLLALAVGVELDLGRAAPRVTRDPHARAETPRELLGEPTQMDVGRTARGRLLPLPRTPGGRQTLGLALGEAARDDLAREAHLLRHPLDRQHGARVARRQL